MLQLAEDIATGKRTAPPGPLVTAEGVAAAQAGLRKNGHHPHVVHVAQQLGMTGADLETQRQQALAQNPHYEDAGRETPVGQLILCGDLLAQLPTPIVHDYRL